MAAQMASAPAASAWSSGIDGVAYNASDLAAGVEVDIDGDGFADFALDGDFCGYGCSSIELTPLTVNTINNEVFSDGSGIAVTAFSDPDGVLLAAANGDPTVIAENPAVLWADQSITGFVGGATAGLLFERPGGSPYIGYVDFSVEIDFGFENLHILESGYELVPEPGTGMLVGAGGLLGLGLLGRRRARSKKAS